MSAAAAERLRLPFGHALRTPDAGGHPDLNVIAVTRETPDLKAQELAATAESLRTPAISIRDAPAADRLGAGLEAAGWRSNRLLFMAHDGRTAQRAPQAGAIDPSEIAPLRREWLSSIPELAHERILRSGAVADRRVMAGTATSAFGIREGGRVVAIALLIGEGRELMVEDVYTTPTHRGRGLATALVSTTVAEAQEREAELIWLCTDGDGLAQRLYERLGFAPVGVLQRFFAPGGP